MAGYNTEADFKNNYTYYIERRMLGVDLNAAGPKVGNVKLAYHSAHIKPIVATRWEAIIPSILNILSTDKVVVVGAAFGWSVEKIEELTGCLAIGIDISDYIDTAKVISEDTELVAAIQEAGYDETTGRGLAIFNYFSNPAVRSVAVILKEDMLSNRSRNEVKKALGNSTPTYIITEDVIQDMTDIEIAAWVTEAEKLAGAVVVHFISSESVRTAENINALTGHKVILGSAEKVVG